MSETAHTPRADGPRTLEREPCVCHWSPCVCAAPQGEGARERLAFEVWAGSAYPSERDHPDVRRIWEERHPRDTSVLRAFATADRILGRAPSPSDRPRLSCGHDIADQFGRCALYDREEGYCTGVLAASEPHSPEPTALPLEEPHPEGSEPERVREVGCVGDDGLLTIHPESETCEWCAPTTPEESHGNV